MVSSRVTCPFKKPPRARASSAVCKLVANPKTSMLNPVPANPVRSIGLRPTISLNLPHMTLVENSAKAKAEVTKPA